jgi:Tfp pilus assembly protein PilF
MIKYFLINQKHMKNFLKFTVISSIFLFCFSVMASENANENTQNLAAQKAIQRFDQALEMIQKNKLSEAKSVLVSLTVDYPELPEPYINIAVIESKLNNYFAAADTLYQALEMHNSNPLLLENSKKIDAYIAALPPADSTILTESKNIESFINNWRDAWSEQNVNDYLKHYSKAFKPSKGLSLSNWENQRRERIETPESIRISVENLKVKFQSSQLAIITFKQTYVTSKLQSVDFKRIHLARLNGRWSIAKEDAYPFRSKRPQ